MWQEIPFGVKRFPKTLLVAPVLDSTQVSAQGATSVRNGADATGQGTDDSASITEIFQTITNALLFIIGAVAVVMLIYGGFRYVTSGGDASAVTSAKNTILYAIVGLIIAFLAFAAVNWILGAITPGSGSGFTNT